MIWKIMGGERMSMYLALKKEQKVNALCWTFCTTCFLNGWALNPINPLRWKESTLATPNQNRTELIGFLKFQNANLMTSRNCS